MNVQSVDTIGSKGTETTTSTDEVLLLMPEEETQKSSNKSSSNITSENLDNRITIDVKESSNEVSDKSSSNTNAHQFQISIHAGHEEDLELNFDSFNDSTNTQANNTNNNNNNNDNDTSKTSNNNDQLNLNVSNFSNENLNGDVGESKLEPVNTSSSNGSINESGEQLKVREAKKEKDEDDSQKNKEKNSKVSRLGIDEMVINDIKYIFKNTRYFLMKSNNFENIELAKSRGVWSTPKVNEIRLNKAFRECANVLLIFSVSESGRFQGYARLASECRQDPNLQVNWILPPMLSARSLMGVFKIDWITKNELNFTRTQHLFNPWNENKPVKIGRDGQEFEPHCGELLCRSFDLTEINLNPNIENKEKFVQNAYAEINKNLVSIISKSKQRHIELAERAKRRERGSRSRSSSRDRRSDSGNDDRSSRTGGHSSGHLVNETHSYNNTNNYRHRDLYSNHSSYSGRKRNYYNNQNPNFNYPMQNDIKNNYGYNMNMSQSQAVNFQNPNIHQHIMHHPSNGLPIQTHSQQTMYMPSGHPIPHIPVQVQNHIEYSSNIPSNNSSSNYKSTTRHRSTSPKKRRMSPEKYLPVPKDVVLNSTYEEYVAAAAAALKNKSINQVDQTAVYYQSNPNYPYDGNQIGYQMQQQFYQNNQLVGYNGYQNGLYMTPGGLNPSLTSSDSKPYNSKYEQDVEEFLRRTTASGTSNNQASHESKSDRDKDKGKEDRGNERSSHKDHKSDREREKDYHRSHHQKHRSSSREKTSRRKSKERR